MTTLGIDGLEVRQATGEDWTAIGDLRELAFRFRGTREQILPGMWLATARDVVIGCARLQVEGQWFGGRILATGLVSSFAVAPEARGRGVSQTILRVLLDQAKADGCVGVSLYPSALQPYRRAGFGVAGSYIRARLRLESIHVGTSMSVEPLDDDVASLASQYARWGETTDGAIARSDSWWRQRVLSSDPPTPHGEQDGAAHAYVVRDGRSVVGHVVYSQREIGGEAYLAEIACRSLAWDGPEAARAILRFLAGGVPLVTEVTWPAALHDPLGAFVDSQPEVVSTRPWMHRLVDPAAAIRGRAYPATARANFSVRVEDPFVPNWAVTLSIAVRDGAANVEETPDAAPSVGTDVLAAILTGGLHPRDAARLGWLPGDPAVLAGMTALAPTGRRWIGDTF